MSNPVSDAIIYIDADQPMNLQNQIRQKLVDDILIAIRRARSGRRMSYLQAEGRYSTRMTPPLAQSQATLPLFGIAVRVIIWPLI